MSKVHHYIAIDLGAESGRVMLVTYENEKFEIRQMHRFANGPIEQNGSLRWDFEHIFRQIKIGLKNAFAEQSDISSIGVDTWGVDFGFLDDQDKLLEKPYHYRDSRNNGMIEQACKYLPKEKIYSNSGIQFLQFNTLFQLLVCKKQNQELLEKAKTLMFIPNLIMFYLTGKKFAEYTIASTSQIIDMRTGKWSDVLLEAMQLPKCILPEVIEPGKKVGVLTKELADELGAKQVDVVTVGTHDTASAVAGVPSLKESNWAYLSSGTWSLMGIEVDQPIINEDSFKLSVTNEGGVEKTFRVLKNIMGLWLVQQCRSQWQEEGIELDYSVLTQMASKSKPFQSYIDPDYKEFLLPGHMPDKINAFMRISGQNEIHDKGQMVRVIFESLAIKYRQVLNALEKLADSKIEILHIVGGGCQNDLLNQFTAEATGKKVICGPIEGTVLGNAMVQALAAGHIQSIWAGRKAIADSFPLKIFTPKETEKWENYIKCLKANKVDD